MGKKVYFLDSVKQSDGSYDNTYGVDDINAIVSNLVGAGVAPFPSGDTYDVSELNSLTNALVAEGTSLDGLKVSFADNKIHIAQGIGYFENGTTIVVDSDGEKLDYNVAETLYVYAEYNRALNTCGFYTSQSKPAPSTGIYVLVLATITADGTVTDKRVIAQSKVATLGRNECRRYAIVDRDTSDTTNDTYCAPVGEALVIWEQMVDISRFNLVLVKCKATWNGSTADGWAANREIEIEEGVFPNTSVFVKYWDSSRNYSLMLRYNDGKLQLYIPASESGYTHYMMIHSLCLNIY